jgi:DNA-binding response OmpR family regulator
MQDRVAEKAETSRGRKTASGSESKGNGNKPKMKSIVLYSSDVDFCISFMLLFQDRYKVTTTSDIEMLTLAVEQHHPDLVIADAVPNERMASRFTQIKQQHPDLPIILFYVSRLENLALKENIVKYVDAMFSKPIDISEVTRRINELVMKN